MSPADILLAEHACAKLAIRYANCLDHYEDDAIANLFAPDGVWEHFTAGPLLGREAIRAFCNGRDRRQLMRHIATNFETEILSPTQARGRSYWTAFRLGTHTPGEPGLGTEPFSVGQYADEFVCIDGQWYFSMRKMQVVFKQA